MKTLLPYQSKFPVAVVLRHCQLRSAFQVGLFATLLILCGCASGVPEIIRTAPLPEVSVAQVRAGKEQRYDGTEVRWGGQIANVENGSKETLIQVVSQPLGQEGRPTASDVGEGRFLAKFAGFLDPVIYAQGRQLTVVGVLSGEVRRSIGAYPYSLPVVEVKAHYLWEDPGGRACEASSRWWCDCCFYPYYRYGWPYDPYRW